MPEENSNCELRIADLKFRNSKSEIRNGSMVTLTVDGVPVTMPVGSMVAAAILKSGKYAFRRSATGEPRGPLCGMGICFECRVTIDGEAHCRSCQTLCENGMDVRTDG
jgi:predicted molibdopterin-dependent oxidoreductase YjgC